MNVIHLDCTLRDGGYYNNWDFPLSIINQYLQAMSDLHVDYVELGFRSLNNAGFKGACAFTTEEFIQSLDRPENLKLGVMVNASELLENSLANTLEKLFPIDAKNSHIQLVRIACHTFEFETVLPAVPWLKEKGYTLDSTLCR